MKRRLAVHFLLLRPQSAMNTKLTPPAFDQGLTAFIISEVQDHSLYNDPSQFHKQNKHISDHAGTAKAPRVIYANKCKCSYTFILF